MENVFCNIIISNKIVVEWHNMNVNGKMINVNMLLVLLTQRHHLVVFILVFGMDHLVYIVQYIFIFI